MREFREPTASQSRFAASRRQTSLADGEGVVDLAEVQASEVPRILTGIGEFDRVTGGGLVPGGVGLIGGDPGIGGCFACAAHWAGPQRHEAHERN